MLREDNEIMQRIFCELREKSSFKIGVHATEKEKAVIVYMVHIILFRSEFAEIVGTIATFQMVEDTCLNKFYM